ncbi:MAG: glycosyltransferase family 87 protein [Chloroflexota bacterium]
MVIVITLLGLLWLTVSVAGENHKRIPPHAIVLPLLNLFTVDLLVRGNYEGFLALGLAMAWVGYKTERPLLSGIGVAIFITKPINMILPGLFFAAISLRRGVRYSVFTALPTLILLLMSFPLFGWDWMVRYVTYTTTVESTYTTLSFDNTALYLQTALWRTFEFWGLPQAVALFICGIGLLATAIYIVTRPKGTARALIITLCAALVFGIYVHGNHYVLLAPALAALIARDWRYSAIWLLTFSPLLRLSLNRFDVAWTDSLYAITLLVVWVSIAVREHSGGHRTATG